MAKKRTTQPASEKHETSAQPVLSRGAYTASMAVVFISLAIQIIIAAIVYPSLSGQIPSGWLGSSQPYNMVSSIYVFLYFPIGQLALLLVAFFSPVAGDGRKAMYMGKAESIITLSLLFTVLQASAFHLPHQI
jgi:uncharacterized membrane protein